MLLTSLKSKKKKHLPCADRCGTCRRCLDACPTGALIAPYQMDAALCISYLTIEHRGAIAPELMAGNWPAGLRLRHLPGRLPLESQSAQSAADPELEARPELVNPALERLAAMEESEFDRQFNGSPVRRAGFLGLRRNLAIAMGNSGLRRFTPRLREWAEAADEGLRSAAHWALKKLRDD